MTKIRIDDNKPGAYGLLIRHGERDEVEAGSIGVDAQLTENGCQTARELGQSLAHIPLNKVITSPIDRCFDTGVCFCEGYGLSAEEAGKTVARDMAVTAAYVNDSEQMKKTFATRPIEQVILDQLSGADLPGFRSLEEGSRFLLDFMTSHMAEKSLSVFVSHDAIVMPFQAHFCSKSFSMSNWVGYLEGSVVYMEGGDVMVDGVSVKGD